MIFGVFDRLHAGHISFVRQARQYGDELIAVVARDEVTQELKGKTPQQTHDERIVALACLPEISRAVLGDETHGSYDVIAAHKPDVICVGYDQHALAEDLYAKMQGGTLPIIQIQWTIAHKPEQFHTSLLEKIFSSKY